ncbi:MAG TPA: SdrD B-like domain-containing protein, partial [Azonexus sp.]|nr:SdrD B-like domain-containing protein [Azonexus sp.]
MHPYAVLTKMNNTAFTALVHFFAEMVSITTSTKNKFIAGNTLAILFFGLVLGALTVGEARAATTVDLGVSAHTWTPDPIVRGGSSTFTITVTNNDMVSAADTLTLAVDLPTNVDFTGQAAPANCAFNLVANPNTLTCTKATLAAQGTWSVSFDGVGATAGVQTTTATVSSSTNTDPNGGNDASTKNTTVTSGADLAVTKTGPGGCVTATPCNTTAGSTIGFTVHVANNGPDPATTFRVTDNLPATADFTYQSATGSGWTCGVSGTTLTCDYSGANVASGAAAPDITVTGVVITSAGTITNGASVASTDGVVGDPVPGNNGPSLVVVNVAPGTSLRANKTMVSAATGMTSFATGEAVNLTLSATNQGPQNATGVTVTDTVSADFTLGVLPAGCSAVGQAITCTVGALSNGVTSTSFVIPLTVVGAAGNSGTNTANVARVTPASGNNTSASVNYTLAAPFAHLTIAKIKTPTPVAAGADITNTITVTNSNTSTSAATGVIRVTDALDANENFVSFSGSGWSCSGVAVGATGTVTCDYAGANLARGASLPALVIITQAAVGYLGTISNTACTGLAAGSPHVPADNGSSCQSRSVTGSHRHVDLTVAKSASIAAPTHVLTTDNSVAYTLLVSNAGPDVAPTVNVSDPIPGWYNGPAGTTGGSAVITGAVAGESCTFASTVTCTLKDVASGSPRTITITLNRPFGDGSFTNNANVSTPDAIDDVPGNNTGSAGIIVDPIADAAVTNVASSPDPVKVGVQLTYTTSIKNNGPSTAAGVVLRHTIDPAKMTYVAASASLTTGGSCGYVASFVGAPYAGQAGIECNGFTLANGESRQLTFSVIPVYPYPGGVPNSYASAATITTTTVESDAPGYANNSFGVTSNIAQEAIDLSVTDNDPGYDPTAFGDAIVYQVKAQNNGPSQATGLKLTVTPTPPAQGVQANPYTMAFNAAGSTLPGGATCSQPGGAGTDVVCYLGADQAHSVQAPNSSNTFNLMFDTGPLTNVPPSSITYRSTVKVESYETGASPFAGDSLSGNNSVTETTTVLPKTDLHVASKTVSKPVVDLNETFTYTIVVGNKGPSDASGARMTDVLPAGLVRTAGAIVVTPGSGVALSTNSCSGPASGANGTVTCDLGPIPADATGVDATKQVSIAIPVRAAYQASGTYSFAFNTNIGNSASIAPLPNTSIDVVAGNNTNTVNVQVRKNSIAGYVYTDNNLDDTMDAAGAEGVGSVTLTLTGTDSYGYTYGSGMNYAARTTTTSATAGVNKGSFLFDKLPPGNWTIVETQPANYWDRFETAGTAGGTAPANTCDGSANCASAAAANTIGAIALPADTATAATGYIFQEYQRAQISGMVYSDANNDGAKAAGEPGIQSATATLSGTAYNGVNVCSLVTCAVATNASGVYSYANLPPADAGGYTLTETTPSGYLNGKTTAGTASGTNAVAGAATGANSDVIQAIKVYSNGNSINNNFGELQPATLSGYVFIDANANALRDGTETTGLTGLAMTLTGTDDLGAVNTTVNTGVSGSYSFTNLRPGTYQVDEPVIAGLTHTGLTVGSKAGDGGGGAVAANTAVTGAANRSISAITLAVGDVATNYNFGEGGQGLSGYVYVDLNNNGVKDAGEPGIVGVSVTLSGTTAGGGDVCAAISPNPCTVQTDTNGAYAFNGLPASNGSGYTLTEQSQAAAPLSNYGDGIDAVGTVNAAATGSMTDDRLAGIVIPVGGIGSSYNFGELGASLSGKVYLDADVGGTFNAGDSGIQNVTVTLSGKTASGADVCAVISSCSRTSDVNGNFSFAGLPASGAGVNAYTLTETQPADYGDSANNLGTGATAAGTAGSNVFTGIQLGVAQNAIDYRFGEKAGTISGFVYLDANNDGIKLGVAETGIAGVTLTITGTAAGGGTPCGQATCTATTAADGSYSFTGVKNAGGAGYTITETQPAAYIDGIVKKGTENGGACASGCVDTTPNIIGAIPFGANKTYAAFNFGELQGVSVAGRVWNDAQNNNGTYEAGEELAGVTLTLSGNDDRGAAVNATATTAADGSYSFAGLRPSGAGGYTVTETQPAGIGNYAGATGTQVGTIGGATTGSAGAGADA